MPGPKRAGNAQAEPTPPEPTPPTPEPTPPPQPPPTPESEPEQTPSNRSAETHPSGQLNAPAVVVDGGQVSILNYEPVAGADGPNSQLELDAAASAT
jgi:hypothetical protein